MFFPKVTTEIIKINRVPQKTQRVIFFCYKSNNFFFFNPAEIFSLTCKNKKKKKVHCIK